MNETQVRKTYEQLLRGDLVLLPTDVGFGLVACTDAAVARIYELKGRPLSKPCVTVATPAILDDVALVEDPRVRAWLAVMSSKLPIAVVAPLRPSSRLVAGMSPLLREQATHEGTIAAFLNAGPWVTALAELAAQDGRVVVGSSANVAFTGNNYALEEVPASIKDRVDLIIPGPRARYHHPDRLATTILDLRSGGFLRKGLAFEAIRDGWDELRGTTRAAVTV